MTTVFALTVVDSTHADLPALTVNGNQILSGGEVKSFAGNSFFWSNTGWNQEKMYNASVVKWLKDDWKSAIVRVALGADEGGSYLEDPEGNVARIETVVDAANANDLYVIIDFHSHHAEDKKAQAIAFFEQMAQKYGTYNNVIYEIYNEPLQISWSDVIKPYAEDVISAIRSIDPDNLIIVGTPTWSQDVDVASQDPIMGNNIAYTLHFYAGTHRQGLRDKALMAMNNGIALMVTEWGSVSANGDGAVDETSTNEWMAFLKDHNLTHLNWAVSDKNEGSSIINPGADPTGNWSVSDLTDSGRFVKNIISNWSNGSSTPEPEPNPTPIPDEAGASCEHIIINSWQDGFQGIIRITNNSNNTLNGWAVNWSYSDGTTINQSWNAQISGNGSYAASNVDWNANIEPSQSVEFGFIAQGGGSASAVTGNVCSANAQKVTPN
jgi:aryl-phospho-beta-D-glucosidase BglC (GH1 family)